MIGKCKELRHCWSFSPSHHEKVPHKLKIWCINCKKEVIHEFGDSSVSNSFTLRDLYDEVYQKFKKVHDG